MRTAEDVYKFWFVDHDSDDWFGGEPEFDALLDAEFRVTHEAVAAGQAWQWRTTPRGRLSEIIVLDQFSRQLHRAAPLAFASDTMALVLAQEMVAHGLDQALSASERQFAYMPYMHSESLIIHQEALRLFGALGNEDNLKYENLHIETLKRFGRYPKRNKALGRKSTPDELAYIAENAERSF